MGSDRPNDVSHNTHSCRSGAKLKNTHTHTHSYNPRGIFIWKLPENIIYFISGQYLNASARSFQYTAWKRRPHPAGLLPSRSPFFRSRSHSIRTCVCICFWKYFKYPQHFSGRGPKPLTCVENAEKLKHRRISYLASLTANNRRKISEPRDFHITRTYFHSTPFFFIYAIVYRVREYVCIHI